MNNVTTVGLLAFLFLSGVALANQVEDEKKASSVQGTMQQMMGGGKAGEGMGGMGDMMGMMGQMTKMMDQCTAMMGSGKSETQKAK